MKSRTLTMMLLLPLLLTACGGDHGGPSVVRTPPEDSSTDRPDVSTLTSWMAAMLIGVVRSVGIAESKGFGIA